MCYFPYCCDKILHRSDLSKKFTLAHGLESTVQSPMVGEGMAGRAAPWVVVGVTGQLRTGNSWMGSDLE